MLWWSYIHPEYMAAHMAYMYSVVSIFVSDTSMTITCEVDAEIGCF